MVAQQITVKPVLEACAQAIPAGYQIVPIDPTPEMIEAGESVEDLYRRGTPNTWRKVYRQMLAAAPVQSQGQRVLLDLDRLKPFVSGLGKAILDELISEAAK